MAKRRTVLTERDWAVLRSIGAARLLDREGVEWLHWAGWRPAAGQPEQAARRVATGVRRRLQALLDLDALRVISLLDPLGRSGRYHARQHYMLTRRGAELVGGAERAAPPRDLPAAKLHHAALVGRCYAALAAALRQDGAALGGWQLDAELERDPITLEVPGLRFPQQIVPDATFTLGSRRYLLEADRGTEDGARWAQKVRSYEALAAHPARAERFGQAPLVVLVVAPAGARLRRLAAIVQRGARRPPYLFLPIDRLHPLTVRDAWLRLAATRPGGEPELAPISLWE